MLRYIFKISIVILIAETQPTNSPSNIRIRVSAYIEWFTLATNRVITVFDLGLLL